MSDIIVVGGGPAGAVTALLLARAGMDVMLLEQHAFPRAKPCGDCISPGANAILARIGVLDRVRAAGPAELTGWHLSAHGDATFGAGFGSANTSFAIERARFDAILLDAARDAGVFIRTSARVTDVLRTDGRVRGVRATIDGGAADLPARLTVGADGLRSRVARRLEAHVRPPKLRKVSFTAHVRGVPHVRAVGELYVRSGTTLGIAPVESGPDPLCNVTVVLSNRAAAMSSRSERRPIAMMREALARFPERDLSPFIRDDTAVLASGPFDWPVRRVAHEGAALVGDAAGYYDPFTGQGIFQALAGAELLARHVRTESLATYDRAYRAMLAPARRIQHGVEFVCGRPAVARTAFRTLARSPRFAERLIQVTGDLRPARDLLWFMP